MPLENFGIVSEVVSDESSTLHQSTNLLVRSAQPDALGFKFLRQLGVRTVIKLCSEREFSLQQEQTLFAPGVVIPDPLAGLFRIGDVDAVIKIAGQIDAALRTTGVHVHCTHGRDRTGLVCAAYRLIYQKATLDDVNAEREVYGVDGIIALFDLPDNEILEEIVRRLQTGAVSKSSAPPPVSP
jgi:hypothetical protein